MYVATNCYKLLQNIFHITGIFYFMLGNVPPKFRSKLSAIQLVAIVETPILSIYGMDAVLQPIVDDIKKLVSELTKCCELHSYARYPF